MSRRASPARPVGRTWSRSDVPPRVIDRRMTERTEASNERASSTVRRLHRRRGLMPAAWSASSA
jgi:hypothetical protein